MNSYRIIGDTNRQSPEKGMSACIPFLVFFFKPKKPIINLIRSENTALDDTFD